MLVTAMVTAIVPAMVTPPGRVMEASSFVVLALDRETLGVAAGMWAMRFRGDC